MEGADTFDNSTEFMTAGCVPEKLFISDTTFPRSMAAIIEPNDVGKERDNKVYIGVSFEDQFFSNGIFAPISKADFQFVGTEDLTPGGLWLYRPVYFRGRKWIVAKLSVTVAAGSEAVSTRGEFIEI